MYDKSSFSLITGLRSAAFAVAPIVVLFATGQRLLVFVTFGAMFLFNTEGQRSTIPLRYLTLAAIIEAVGIALGTLAGIANEFAFIFVGIGVFVSMLVRRNPVWTQIGLFAAITFAIGVGLPGAGLSSALDRLFLYLIGSMWALSGIALSRFVSSRRNVANGRLSDPVSPQQSFPTQSEILRQALVLGVGSAIGFGIGQLLGLPRDFWVVVTILFAVRPHLRSTITTTSSMVFGTIVGALIAAGITTTVHDPVSLLTLLFIFGVFMFATRGVNVGLVQTFLTPFIIVLIDLLYPGHLEYALVRIVDVIIGGAISIVVAVILNASAMRNNLKKASSP